MKFFSFFLIFLAFLPNFPEPIQNFAIYDQAGNRLVLHEEIERLGTNGVILLNFTSIHCKPCLEEIPELKKIANLHKTVRLYFIFSESKNEVVPFVIENRLEITPFLDPLDSVKGMLQIQATPTTILVRKDKSYRVYTGYNQSNITSIRNLIQ